MQICPLFRDYRNPTVTLQSYRTQIHHVLRGEIAAAVAQEHGRASRSLISIINF